MQKILVVEPNPEMGALLTLTLRMEGYEVLRMIDGESTLLQLNEFVPDLITCEVALPAMSGFELAQELAHHETPALRDIPIFFVTKRSELEDVVQGLEIGRDYLTKPFAVPEFIARVRNIFRNRPLNP